MGLVLLCHGVTIVSHFVVQPSYYVILFGQVCAELDVRALSLSHWEIRHQQLRVTQLAVSPQLSASCQQSGICNDQRPSMGHVFYVLCLSDHRLSSLYDSVLPAIVEMLAFLVAAQIMALFKLRLEAAKAISKVHTKYQRKVSCHQQTQLLSAQINTNTTHSELIQHCLKVRDIEEEFTRPALGPRFLIS